ncbi:MAG: type IV pilus assembly protein PilM [Fimbriimonadaceae bacterium]
MSAAAQPENRALTSLGVDIGTRMTKVIGLSTKGDHLEIQAAINFKSPVDLIVNGVVSDPKAFGRLLAHQLLPTGCRFQQAVFSIPTNLAVLRWINLPNVPADELRQAAQYKVKRHLPFPVEEAYVEATPPNIADSEETGTSLVIAVRRDIVASRAQAMLYAGLEPIRAELEAQAILRVIERRLNNLSVLWRDASLTIIDIGGSNTHMYVVQNQRLQFMRGVKFGASLFGKAVADALDVSFEEGSELLATPGAVLGADGIATIVTADGSIRVNLSDPLDKLTREFMRLLRYFRSLHPERSYAGILDNMVVCGGLVGLDGLCDYLGRCLGLKVESAQPIAGVIAKFNRESFQSISNRQEALAVVMGLALSGISQQVTKEAGEHAGREFSWTSAA